MNKIYQLTSTGNIKIIEILSETPLPNKDVCYELKNNGFVILGRKKILQIGQNTICLGLTALKNVIINKPAFIIEYEEKIKRFKDYINEMTIRVEEYEKGQEGRLKIIEIEKASIIENNINLGLELKAKLKNK
jgi:hypothetical protein